MKKVVLVAFGDSLTVGFKSPTLDSPWDEPTPYTYFLEQRIGDTLRKSGQSNTTTVKVYNKGATGELTIDMLSRFDRDVVGLKPNCVIILGGSNDIGWETPSQPILNNLKKMCIIAKRNSVEPMVSSRWNLEWHDDELICEWYFG